MDKSLCVLAVEDSDDDFQLLLRELRRGDYDLTADRVDTAAAMRAALDRQAWDIIISDYRMPQFDAPAALTLLRERGLDVPFIIVSGTIGEETAVAAVKAGASDYLMKGNLTRLVTTVERELREAEVRRAGKRAEAALQASEERYRSLFDRVPVGLYRSVPGGQIVDANPALVQMLGYPDRESLLAVDVVDLYVEPAETRARWRSLIEREEVVRDFEAQVRRRDGKVIWIRQSARAVRDDDGRVLYYEGAIEDITARKQRQRELEAIATIATALRAASTRADMLPVVLDQALALLQAQGAALAMRDPTTGEAVVALARGAWKNWNGGHIPPGEGITGRVIATGQPYLSNSMWSDPQLRRPDLTAGLPTAACAPLIAEGATIGVLWVGRRTDIGDDELRLLVAIADIAANALRRALIVETLEQRVAERTRELAEANERLTELDRLKSKFVSDVSHELRTPVTNLKLYVELLERGKLDRRAQYMDTLKQQADRLAQLVEDILDLSRLERASAGPVFAPLDLNTLVEQVVAAYAARAEAAGLSLIFEPGADLPPAHGDYNQLTQVVTNLVTNAINYTPAGEVRVSTYPLNNRVCLQVRDTGRGIDPQDMSHLFERFYRGQNASQLDIPGSGLGLAIVKEIVDLHEGRIEVDSRIGEGSTFRVWLPMAPGAT